MQRDLRIQLSKWFIKFSRRFRQARSVIYFEHEFDEKLISVYNQVIEENLSFYENEESD